MAMRSGSRSRLAISSPPLSSGGRPSRSRTSLGRIQPPRIAFWNFSASVTLRIYAHALRRRDEDAAQAAQGLLDHAQLGEELGDKKE